MGQDGFGVQLRQVAAEAGINVDGLLTDPQVHTTLAIVQTLPGGDRDFSFYRNPGADMMLRADELPEKTLQSCSIFHFGTLSMTHPGVREATKRAVAIAKEAGAHISFDPNLREPLWRTLDEAKEQMAWGMGQCDILKISDNEIQFFTGETDFDRGAEKLQAEFPNLKLLNVTAGADGSYSYCCGQRVFVPSFRLGGTIETTGAGDTFCASVLHDVLQNGLEDRTAESLRAMLRFANAAAYLVTTKRGAIRSMPEKADVDALLAANPA